MRTLKFHSTHDLARELRDLAARLDAVPDLEIPETKVDLELHVFGYDADASFDAVDHLVSILTDDAVSAELRHHKEHCHYGLSIDAAEAGAPGNIAVSAVTLFPPDEVASLLLEEAGPVEVAA